MIILIAVWLFLSLVVALFGASRKIGFSKSLLSAVFLTPLIGIIVTALSKSKKDIAKKDLLEKQTKEYFDLLNSKKK